MSLPPAAPKTALVLGAKLSPDGRATGALRRRAGHAAQLWHRGEIDLIVVSGGVPQSGITEASVMADLLRETGVSEERIILEDQARNTWENIALSRPLIPEGAEITLITDSYHAPRARLMARRQGVRVRVDCLSDRHTPLPLRLQSRLREAAAMLYYLFLGPRL
ncbi:YdcF family protein [Aliiroseovarius crassostreae]|uniref:YdcF family protein n=1 Tax=Aliiroseovarius crassostreae TaxID=154981 RepID=UPI00220F9640|nr:YdcF family protein [Aliiroseovarius crassostreae]UWQ11710.1 YdcF family protein [Aliiroseovarius crassostreae]